MAQETIKQKEIGLVFRSLDAFGLTYRTGTNKSLWRFNTLLISGSNQERSRDSLVTSESNIGFGIQVGKEFRKVIVERLELRIGADISFNYNHSKSEYNEKTVNDFDRLYEQTTYTPGVNLVFGFNYRLGDNFKIGAELLPSLRYTTGTSIEKHSTSSKVDEFNSDISGFDYGLSNTSILLSSVYVF